MPAGESAFWQFSLRFYRRREVPALCLQLQDECGIDVNVLFFILFLATNGRRVAADEMRRIDDSVSDWRRQVVQRLRAIRRGLKAGIAPVEGEAAEALRSAIKRDELQAERLQQEALEREFPLGAIGQAAMPRDAAAANVAAYGAIIGGWDEKAANALLAALAAEFSL